MGIGANLLAQAAQAEQGAGQVAAQFNQIGQGYGSNANQARSQQGAVQGQILGYHQNANDMVNQTRVSNDQATGDFWGGLINMGVGAGLSGGFSALGGGLMGMLGSGGAPSIGQGTSPSISNGTFGNFSPVGGGPTYGNQTPWLNTGTNFSGGGTYNPLVG